MKPIGSILHERYVIEELLGEGGMGAVYRARVPAENDRRVALKEVRAACFPPAELGKAQLQLREEARLMATLRHPGLAEFIECFEDGPDQYLVMAYVDGSTLDRLIEEASDDFPLTQVLDWIDQACDVLEYLHGHGPPILLRDVKPANIILGTDGRIRVIDFGIARAIEGANKTRTFIKGAASPGFAPLEQYGSSSSTDERADIYGLGATLYALLTRTIPPSALERLDDDGLLEAPSSLNPQVSPALDQVVLKMMAMARQERYPAVSAARAALRAVAALPIPRV